MKWFTPAFVFIFAAFCPAAEPISGSLVTGFGEEGLLLAKPAPGLCSAEALAVQADGKILLAGTAVNTLADCAVVRFLPDGTPDTAFGSQGAMILNPGGTDALYDIGLLPNGGFLAVGHQQLTVRREFIGLSSNNQNSLAMVLRLGSVDLYNQTQHNFSARVLLQQPDGKLILGGVCQQGTGITDTSYFMVRFNANRSVDTTFNTYGYQKFGGTYESQIDDMALHSDGKIIVVGHSKPYNSPILAGLFRLNSDGRFDSTFKAPQNFALGNRHTFYYAVAVDRENRIVCGGNIKTPTRMLLSRFLPDGELDPDFGAEQGHLLLEPGGSINDIIALPNGKYMICGSVEAGALIGRMLENGRFDPSFGPSGSGYAIIPKLVEGRKMARLNDSQWIVVGRSLENVGYMAAAAVHEGPPSAWVTVTHLPATPIPAGETLVFSAAAPQTSGGIYELKVSNSGDLPLAGVSVTAESDDFSVSIPSTTELIPGQSVTITVTFTPTGTTAGLRQSRLLVRTTDSELPLYQVELQGTMLSFLEDRDGDGLNDASEYQLRQLGFDFESSQADMVQTLFSRLIGALPNMNQAGFYSEQQIHDLNIGRPLLSRHPETKRFKVKIGLESSQDLSTFLPVPFTVPHTTITPDGKLEFEFESEGNASFYRVTGE